MDSTKDGAKGQEGAENALGSLAGVEGLDEAAALGYADCVKLLLPNAMDVGNAVKQGESADFEWPEFEAVCRRMEKQQLAAECLERVIEARVAFTPEPARAHANLAAAVLDKDMAWVVAWVASGKKWTSKINVFNKRAVEAEHAMTLAAAIGWTDGLKAIGSSDASLMGAWATAKRFVNDAGGQVWAPAGTMKGWREDGKDEANRECSAIGFAAINGNVEAVSFLAQRLRGEERGGRLAVPTDKVFRKGQNPPGLWALNRNKNAILSSILARDVDSAKTLAMAGAGSAGLAEEFAWAAKHSLVSMATMLIEAQPKSSAIRGRIGQMLLALAIEKGSPKLAGMLLELGVNASVFLIHGMRLETVVKLSRSECLAAIAKGGEDMAERDRRRLRAFAQAAVADEAPALENKAKEGAVGCAESKGDPPVNEAFVQEGLLAKVAKEENFSATPEIHGGEKSRDVASALVELEEFEAIVAQMGARIRALIGGLQEGAAGEPPRTIGLAVRKMRERAAGASEAIAKAGLNGRKEP